MNYEHEETNIEINNDIIQEIKGFKANCEKQNSRIANLEEKFMEIKYKQTGEEKNMTNDIEVILKNYEPSEFKSLSSDIADKGEVLIAAERYNKILSEIEKLSPIRKLASTIQISTSALDLLIQNGELDSGWVSERDARDESSTPKLIRKRIAVNEIYSQPKATQRLLEDSSVNLEEWLTSQIAESFSRIENAAFINGDGLNKPKGFLSYGVEIERVKSIEDEKISPEDLLNLINSLDDIYQTDAAFVMNRRTLSAIQGLKDGDGRFIWQSSLSDKMADTIFGIPVYTTSDMPQISKDANAIALADFSRGYKIVDRTGISLMKDPYTEKPFVKFYATKRVGGDVVNFDAIKLLKV
jgi:HK97 family phage major capsid protein